MSDLTGLPDGTSTATGGIDFDGLPDTNESMLRQKFRSTPMAPDAAAKVISLSDRTGMPRPVVERNTSNFERLASEPDWNELSVSAPATTRELAANARLFELAYDDTENLKMMEQGVATISNVRGPKPSFTSVATGLLKALPQGIELARQGLRMQAADLFGFDTTLKDATRKFERAQTDVILNSPEFKSSTAQGLYSGGSSLLRQAPSIALSVLTGSPAPGLAGMGVQTEAEAYGKYRTRGASPLQALAGGVGEGVVEVGTERLGMGFLVDKFGKAGASEFLAGLLAREVPTEQIATLVQDAIDTAIANPDKTWTDYAAERPDAGYQTLVATLTQGGAMGALNTVARKFTDAQQSDQNTAALTALSELAKASKLRARDPKTFEQFVAAANEGNPVQEVYVDARTFAQALNQAGIDPILTTQQVPSMTGKLEQAINEGADLIIPVSEFAAYVAGTDTGKVLLPHLRTSEEGLSQLEAQEFYQSQAAEMRTAAEQVMQEKANDDVWQQSAKAVGDELLSQLTTANRFTPDVNNAYATLMRDFYVTTGARLGITPQEMYQRYPVQIRAESVAGGQQMEQMTAFDTQFPKAGELVDGRLVRKDVPNLSSIGASLGGDYTELPGIREVPISAFDPDYVRSVSRESIDDRTRTLADEIAQSGELNPLIVAIDEKGPYILEGGHRFDALIASGAKSIPAVVVVEDGVEGTGGSGVLDFDQFFQPAYHGSPHDFNKFSLDHIGTGEGAQAYGWGLYFAESTDVAKKYTPRDFDREDQMYAEYQKAEQRGDYTLMEVWETAMLHVLPDELEKQYADQPDYAKAAKKVAGWLRKNPSKSGKVYQVDIPDEAVANMLDWDKPLSEQTPGVVAALESAKVDFPNYDFSTGRRASDFYLFLAGVLNVRNPSPDSGDKKASMYLNSIGIPGTRYLDQNSRDTGDGTRNFVVFDDNIITLTHKDGTPVTPQERGEYFQFAGIASSTVNLESLTEARKLLDSGAQPERVRAQTGWFRGVDGMWRYEISDDEAKFKVSSTVTADELATEIGGQISISPDSTNPGLFKATFGEGEQYRGAWGRTEEDARANLLRAIAKDRSVVGFDYESAKPGDTYRLEDVLDHPKLFAAYPRLAAATVRFVSSASFRGAFYPEKNLIEINTDYSPERALSTLLHEVQHAIQHREGFATGGNSDTNFTNAVKSALEGLEAKSHYNVIEWKGRNKEKIDDAKKASETARYGLMFESSERLLEYSRRDKPSGVFRLIRNEMQWLYDPMFNDDPALKEASREIQGRFYNMPKRHNANKRNTHIAGMAFDAAQLLRKQIPPELLADFKNDERQLKSMIKALQRESDKKRKALQPLRDLEGTARAVAQVNTANKHRPSYDVYRALAGEVEARNTQARQKLTDEGRKDTPPSATQDINNDDVIVMFGGLDVRAPVSMASTDGNRGSINFQKGIGNSPAVISLLKNADLSTFLHEMGHFQLEVWADIASRPDAPAEITNDMNALLEWFKPGMSLDQWRAMSLEEKRPYHEQFARGFEAYLFEGKAPSTALNELFSRFRAWLINVYKSLAALRVELSDDVRSVFNRMIASDTAIKEAEAARAYAPLFKTAEDMGATPNEWEAYQKLNGDATQDAVDNLQSRSLRDMQWLTNARSRVLKQLQKDAAEKRKALRAEVEAEVRQQPVYAVQRFLKYGEMPERDLTNKDRKALDNIAGVPTKLLLSDLKETYGEGPAAPWRYLATGKAGLAGTDGLPADTVAELFGFTSGDELVRSILAAEPESALVDAMTDQRMLERYGDLTDEDSINRAADKAIHNEARARFVATELKALTKAMTPIRAMTKAAKEFAEATLSRKRLREIKPAQHTAAEARAAKAAEKAMAAGDTVTAVTEKRNQLVQNYATRAAYDALTEIEKAVNYLRKFDKEGTRKSLDTEYLDQIDQLLERYDMRASVTNKDAKKRASLMAWVESQRQQGLEPDVPPELLIEAARKPYRETTLEEFRGLVDTVKQIEHLGRLKHKLLTAKDQREFEAVRDELAASITANSGGKVVDLRTRNTPGAVLKEAGNRYLAMHRKMASAARELDGFADGGPMWETFIRTMNEGGDRETTMREQATVALSALIEPLLKTGGKMGGKGMFFPALNMSLNREERIAIALNTGNAGNIQRLLGGESWTPEQVKTVLDTITPEEADFIQSVWDFFEAYRPQIAAKEKRVYGKEPEWVEPTPITLGGKQLRGGYYPIKYDPKRSARAEQHADAEAARQMIQGAYTTATTRRSFTKSRAEEVSGRPLLYSFAGLFQGTNEVIHDLSWHEWLIDVNRLLRSKQIDQAIRTAYGAEMVGIFKKAIEDIAAGDVPAQNVFERGVNHIRTGATVAGLGWNLVTSALQPLGLTQSAVRIGPGWVAKGLGQWMKRPDEAVSEIYEKSEMMRLRGKTMQREINEIQNQVKGSNRSALDATFFMFIQKMQLVADVPTWLGAYEKAIAAGNDDGRAVALADQAVIDAQGGGQMKDLSQIQRGGPLQKLFTNFYSFFNVAYNLGVEKTREKGGSVKAWPSLALDYLLLYIVPSALATLLKHVVSGGDDDELPEKLAADQISYLFGLMVGVREIAAGVQKVAGVEQFNGGYAGPAGLRLLQEIDKLGQQIGQGDADMALFKATNNVGGIVFHYPSGQINKSVEGAVALFEGKTDNPISLLTGPPRP